MYVCRPGGGVGGASRDGPWIHGTTWDSTAKLKVQGSGSWSGSYTETVSGSVRSLVFNDLPTTQRTGTFPVAQSDPAYEYDHNGNRIAEHATTVTLPASPVAGASPGCVSDGPIGVLVNGVFIFDALDGPGRDAVAHELQDLCDGHPAPGDQYHYHAIPSCLRDAATGPSTLVGWAYDGFPIYVERDAAGHLPTNTDLDVCHGRTGAVPLGGQIVTLYHYSATLEYPYTVGCYRGTRANP